MHKHPKVSFSVSKWVHVLNGFSILCILGSIFYVIIAYQNLPDTIPIYFNAQGEADGWGNKAMVFLMPVFTILLFVPMYFVSKAPHIFNYPIEITEENAKRIYPIARLFMTIFNFEIVLIFSYLSIDFIGQGQYLETWLLVTAFAVPLLTIFIFAFTFIRLSRRKT